MKKRFIHWWIILPRAVAEICTCSMLTVTVLLLYRKLIPLRCLSWCDNLVTLGCRWILFFLCFSKVKNSELSVHFEFQVGSPWTKLAEIRRECCQYDRRQNRVCEFWLLFSLKSYAFFFAGSPIFFPFLTLSSCKIITNACAKNLRHGFWGECVKKRMPC